MDYLTLCQNVAGEIGLGYDVPGAVTGQVGEVQRIVKYVDRAWQEIQMMKDWDWMRREFTLTTVASTRSYAYTDCTDVDTGNPIARFRRWFINDEDYRPRIYLQSDGVDGEYYLNYQDYSLFRQTYLAGEVQDDEGEPAHITEDRQHNLLLGLIPDDVYVVTGEFYRGLQTLSADSDEPDMPSDYHFAIVYKAMLYYGVHEVAAEVILRAEQGLADYLDQMGYTDGPDWGIAGPLA